MTIIYDSIHKYLAYQSPQFLSVSILKWLILLQKNPRSMVLNTAKLFNDYKTSFLYLK
jgi:uncharacterized alpha-E superfamily protein